MKSEKTEVIEENKMLQKQIEETEKKFRVMEDDRKHLIMILKRKLNSNQEKKVVSCA